MTGVNDAPTAIDLAFTTSEDGPVLTQALAGDDIDSDDDAKSLTYVLGSLPGKGTLTDNGDGTFTFDPGSDFDSLPSGASENVTFTYQTKDSHGALSHRRPLRSQSPASMISPTASDVKAAANEDGGVVVGSYAVTDVDATGTLSVVITKQPDEGSVTDNGDGTYSFDPAPASRNWQRERQNRSPSDTPRPTQAAPRRRKQSVSLRSPASTTILRASDINLVGTDEVPSITGDFEGDDIDSDDDQASLTYTIVDQPSAGTVVNNGDSTFMFTPGAEHRNLGDNESKSVTFTYTATDSQGAISSEATVFVTIFGINTAPVAADVAATSNEDTPVTTSFNATDKQDAPEDLVYKIVSGPDAGTVTIHDDGTFSFDPGNEFQGLDAGETKDVTFTYTATDSQAWSRTAPPPPSP